MTYGELYEIVKEKGYNLDQNDDGTYALGTVEDDEDFGFCADWIMDHANEEEILEFINNN